MGHPTAGRRRTPGHGELTEPASRAVIAAGALAAVMTMARLGAPEWPALWPLTIAVTIGSAVLGRRWPSVASWLVLPFLYVSAVIILGIVGHSRNAYQAPIAGAVLGLSLAPGLWRPWSLPAAWRLPLTFWGLVVIFGALAVTLRELDFVPALMRSSDRLANSSTGGPPWVLTVWIAYVAATFTVGILWLDSFFARYRLDDAAGFRNHVVLPLALSAAAGAGVASYQGLVDVHWFTGHSWARFGRAAGGLVDGDAFGSLAGLWTGIFLAIAATGGWRMRVIGIGGAAISWVGLWASGSRMALVAGFLATFVALVSLAVPYARRAPWRTLAAGVALVFALAAVLSLRPDWQSASPLQRTLQSLPEPNLQSVKAFVGHQLWNRDAPFGTAFLWVMHDYPLTGIGVGSFHILFPDYTYLIEGRVGPTENAQSWFRHQLAELGIMGSVGWIWWLGLVTWLLVRKTPAGVPAVNCLKASLVTLALVSAVSMPTQHIAASLTVWPLLFWLITLSPVAQRWLDAGAPPRRRSWFWVWGGAMAFALATLVVGWHALRPPIRAVRANWTYSRGFFGVEAGDYSRWTAKSAVEVPHAPARWMRLGIGGGAPDVATNPVRVVVRRNGEQILTHLLTDRNEHVWWVRVPQGPPRIMIEIDVDRTWSPADFGGTDTRRLGVSILPWVFADVPPRDARAIN